MTRKGKSIIFWFIGLAVLDLILALPLRWAEPDQRTIRRSRIASIRA